MGEWLTAKQAAELAGVDSSTIYRHGYSGDIKTSKETGSTLYDRASVEGYTHRHKRQGKDISGTRFGRLAAIESTGRKVGSSYVWRCVCDCGNEVEATVIDLMRGSKKSCGCLADESRARVVEADQADGTRISTLTARTRSDNRSGVRGVSRRKVDGRWVAYITFSGKRHHIGVFDTLQEAAEARREAEQEYFDPVLEAHGMPPTSEEG